MTLLLEMIDGPMGQQPPRRIDRTHLTLGRSSNNDCVLDDPSKEISRRHCRIEWRGMDYYVCDDSANGVFINQSGERLGHGNAQKLAHGDELNLGPYRFRVTIDLGTTPMKVSQTPSPPPDATQPFRATLPKAASESDYAAAKDSTAVNPVTPRAKATLPTGGDETGMTAKLLAAFQRGAKLSQLPELPPELLMEHVGVLLREAVRGEMDLLAAKAAWYSMFGGGAITPRSLDNPIKRYPPTAIDEVLQQLLGRTHSTFPASVEAVREGFKEVQTNQTATLEGIQAALNQVMGQLAPERVQQFVGSSIADYLLPNQRDARCWQAFKGYYAQLSVGAHEDFHRALNKFMANYSPSDVDVGRY